MDNPQADKAPAESLDGETGLSTEALDALAQMGSTPTSPEAGPEAKADAAEPEAGESTESDLSQEPETKAAEPDAEATGEAGKAEDGEEAGPKWFQKRLGHYTAMAKAAKEEADRLREEVKALREGKADKPPEATPADRQLDALERAHPELAKLADEETKARANVAGAQRMLDDMEGDPDRTVAALVKAGLIREGSTEREARLFLKEAERTWSTKASELTADRKVARAEAKRAIEAAYKREQARALELYPWHANPDSPERKAAVEILREFPDFREVAGPKWAILLSRLVEGEKVERERLAGKAAKPKAPPPKLPGSTGSLPPAQRRTDAGSTARKKAIETGSLDDVAAALGAM